MKANPKYDKQLCDHITAVKRCFELVTGGELPAHDASKWSHEEYEAYSEYFFPSDGPGPSGDPKRREAFLKAWWRHQKVNPHHWQYHCLINGDGEVVPMEMPMRDICEMVADWGSFALLAKKGDNLREWWADNKGRMILAGKTRERVEECVDKLAGLIDREVGEVGK